MGGESLVMEAHLMGSIKPSNLAVQTVCRRMRMVVMEHRYRGLHPTEPAVGRAPGGYGCLIAFHYYTEDERQGVLDRSDAAELAHRLQLILDDEKRRWIEDIYPLDVGWIDWDLCGPREPR